ncbi:MAG: pyrimidine-nucleoside phosphorylase [Halanaerobiaceae bacterium]|nr:pyrimidine-nucleoside phosphorylase [Halanaerobiaceae bacterium]
MRVYDLIYKKRQGEVLEREEIRFLIDGYTDGSIPDYQIAAWAMAVFFQGMNDREIADLTMAMAASGDQIDLSPIRGFKVDKHSSGGVGDTTTLVLAPLVSAAGVPVAKLSGRGLGHTGGTIDKLESIPGFRTDLSLAEFIENVNQIGVAVAGQTADLTPADKKLYSLRDVTATVDSIPLIASSIMSKKIAGGADGIVLDVKTGDGAFMEKVEEAEKLARTMVEIGKHLERQTIAVITDMSQPLGYAIGNALEVKEAIATLQGRGPADLTELSLLLGANMLLLAGRTGSYQEGYDLLQELLETGAALEQFARLIRAQGGEAGIIDDVNKLPQARFNYPVTAGEEGYISAIRTRELGLQSVEIGGGRARKDDVIDPAVGFVLEKKVGDRVRPGDTLLVIHANTEDIGGIKERVRKAFLITPEKPEMNPLIHKTIR